ncbi:hypothetical protein HDK64DRAFT_313897 [Phyllosticta capitalensis]
MGTSASRRLRRLHLQPIDCTEQIAAKRRIRHELKALETTTSHELQLHRTDLASGLLTRREYKASRRATLLHTQRFTLQIDPPTPPRASLAGLPRELRQQIFLNLLHDDDLGDDRRPHAMIAQATRVGLVCHTFRADMGYVERVWRHRLAIQSALYAPQRAHFESVARGLSAAACIAQTRALDRRIREERSRRRNERAREKQMRKGERGGGRGKVRRRGWKRAGKTAWCQTPWSGSRMTFDG